MTRTEYYGIREDIGNITNVSKLVIYTLDIMEAYPVLENKTLKEAKEWLMDRHAYLNNRLEGKLIDENESPNEAIIKELKKFVNIKEQ